MNAAVRTADGSWLVDLETEDLLDAVIEFPDTKQVDVTLPLVIATAGAGATIVAVVDRRPPLAISYN